MFYMLDPYYLLLVVLPAVLLCGYAQAKVHSTYSRYSKVVSRRGLSGAELAQDIIRRLGLPVDVELIPGRLSDHYDPVNRVLRLSEGTFYSRSLAALGVAAHELGHAIQHASNYVPLRIRNGIVPAVQLGSSISPLLILMGILFRAYSLINLAILIFSLVVFFRVITLPVELNASRRALRILSEGGYLEEDELPGAAKVLNAAALTYLADALIAMMQLLYFLSLSRRR